MSGPIPYQLERPAPELSSRCHTNWRVEAVSKNLPYHWQDFNLMKVCQSKWMQTKV